MPRSFKFSCEICSSICFCDHQIIARDETVLFSRLFVFFPRDSEGFNVMSGSDRALLTSLKHYKCWDNTNWQTECLRFLFLRGKDTFFFLFSSPPFLSSFFTPFLVFMPFISMAPQCTVGIAAALAPCVRQRERSVSTPSIPQSHTVTSER